MLEVHRNYLLKDTKQLKARVHIIPTGSVKIEILDKKQCHLADFEQIHFERKGNVTQLIGSENKNGKNKQWQLPFDHKDANELANLIDQAADNLEILMRSL